MTIEGKTISHKMGDGSAPLADIQPSKKNPRTRYDAQADAELLESVKAHGIIEPLVLRRVNGKLEIVCGERRYRAAKAAGLQLVPATVRDYTDEQAEEVRLVENLQRADLHPLDEAEDYEKLIAARGLTMADLAAKVGKSTAYVHRRLNLCSLIPPIKKLMLADAISFAVAEDVARLGPTAQAALHTGFTQYGGQEWTRKRVMEWIERNVTLELGEACFNVKDADLMPAAGACVACPKRSGAEGSLFGDLEGNLCMDPPCFWKKSAKQIAADYAALAAKGKKPFLVLPYSRNKPLVSIPGASKPIVLNYGTYTEIEGKKDGCEHESVAVNVGDTNFGKQERVCREKACEKHGGGIHRVQDADNKKREKAQRRKLRVAQEAGALAVEAVAKRSADLAGSASFGKLPMKPLCAYLIGRFSSDDYREYFKRTGQEPEKPKKGEYIGWKGQMEKVIAPMKVEEMVAVLLGVTAASVALRLKRGWGDDGDEKELVKALAGKEWATFEEAAKEALAPKWKKQDARDRKKAKGEAPAKKKRKK